MTILCVYVDIFYIVIDIGGVEHEIETHCQKHINQQLGKEKACGKFENFIILSRRFIHFVLTSDWRRFWFKGF
jgi:hypothetical protein